MPEVRVKLTKEQILTPQQRRDLGPQFQMFVASVLSVPGTQAELRPEEVEVDYVIASPDACMNGLDVVITVEANQYPERAGRAQEFSDKIKELLQAPPSNSLPKGKWNIWVRLSEGGWS